MTVPSPPAPRTTIAVSIYVDHQEVIGYPVNYIVRNLAWADEVWLFGGDKTSTRLLADTCLGIRDNVSVHNIEHKVALPDDIAIARNKTETYLREHSKCDWFVTLSADTLPTSAAVERMIGLAEFHKIVDPRHVPTHCAELYCDVGSSPFGCTFFPRTFVSKWDGDGSYHVGSGGGQHTAVPQCLHLGYIGTDAVGKHMAQHAITWNAPHATKRYELYQRDRRAFVRDTLLDIRERRTTAGAHPQRYIESLIFVDEPEFWLPKRFEGVPGHDLTHRVNAEYLSQEYGKAIDALGLRSDLEFVRSVANEIGRDWSGRKK